MPHDPGHANPACEKCKGTGWVDSGNGDFACNCRHPSSRLPDAFTAVCSALAPLTLEERHRVLKAVEIILGDLDEVPHD